MSILKELDLAKAKINEKSSDEIKLEIGPLFPGFGVTLGHALRRVMLSSLKGSAITSAKIDGITHEFSNIKGVKEDVTNIILNLKHLTVKSYVKEPVTLKLSVKGPKIVTAKDFKKNSDIEIINPEQHIATLEKNGKLDLEITIEQGYGYVPVEKMVNKKLSLGDIAIDAIYNPIKKINYIVENTRVGSATNYDKLIFTITTNGTITPAEAFTTANDILIKYFQKIMPEKNQSKKNVKKITKKVKKSK